MTRTPKPTCKEGPAHKYAAPAERIMEFSDHLGNGGLISLFTDPNGKLVIDLYRLNGVVIRSSGTK